MNSYKKYLTWMTINFIVIITLVIITEVTSYILIKSNIRFHSSRKRRDKQYKINSWVDVERFSTQNDGSRVSKISKWIKEWEKVKPEYTYDKPDRSILQEPSVYVLYGQDRGKYFETRNLRFQKSYTDRFGIKAGSTDQWKYLTTYSFNQFGRVSTNYEKRNTAKRNYIFIGCSFTFGEGVENKDKFATRFAYHSPETQTHNYGFPGTSLNFDLKQIRNPGHEYFDSIDDKPTYIVYTFINDHMRRIIHSARYHRHFNNDFGRMANFVLKEDKLLLDNYSLYNRFKWLAGKSNFLTFINYEIPFPYSEREYGLVARLAKSIKVEAKARKENIKDLYFAIFPDENYFAKRLIPYLKREGIKTLDYSMINTHVLLNGFSRLRYDDHPSPLTHDLYAYLLSKELEN